MACKCKSEIEAKLLERLKVEHPDAKGHAVVLEGYGFIFGDDNSMKQKGVMAVDQSAVFTAKNGNERRKTIKMNMVFTFCPFCGVRYNDPAVEKESTQ